MANPKDVANNNDASNEDLSLKFARYIVSPVLLKGFEEAEKNPENKSIFLSVDAPEAPRQSVIIDLNLDHAKGAQAARTQVIKWIERIGGQLKPIESRLHVFAKLTLPQVSQLIELDKALASSVIYKIWPDRKLESYMDRSIKVIKADACAKVFGSDEAGIGEGVIWGVIDSGIDGKHPHFSTYNTLDLDPKHAATPMQANSLKSVKHYDFTGENAPLVDEYGHGTHVAGIIAGATPKPVVKKNSKLKPRAAVRLTLGRDERSTVRLRPEDVTRPYVGVAPRCKLVSLKVLDETGAGEESALLAALDYIARINEDGRKVRINGVNISIGYAFDAEWFAAGQSPICVAVNRLVEFKTIVVVAAGNYGSVILTPEGSASSKRVGLSQTIADPGNADLAITVGSTHAESPETYGISHFSSRGPTADGREKPDLVAPGERIVSCASQSKVRAAQNDELLGDVSFTPEVGVAYYREESGTSMAAPHVSGAAAAFLSIHTQFIKDPNPRRIKEILISTATDLKRKRDFQGAGLVDVFRAVQSI
jgi:serine protease AprX